MYETFTKDIETVVADFSRSPGSFIEPLHTRLAILDALNKCIDETSSALTQATTSQDADKQRCIYGGLGCLNKLLKYGY